MKPVDFVAKWSRIQQTESASAQSLADLADIYRVIAYQEIASAERAKEGQYLTPPAVAGFMASLFGDIPAHVKLLDPGAGTGALTAAFVDRLCADSSGPQRVSVTAYESDARLDGYLDDVLRLCAKKCSQAGIEFDYSIVERDFIIDGALSLRAGATKARQPRFNRVIMNPPYGKIASASQHRRLLRRAGIETVNLYAGFVALAVGLLEPGGELVAITPRSFANGPYYEPFRRLFLESMRFRRIHLYEARDKAFADDEVLQENVIFHAVRTTDDEPVVISTSMDPDDELHAVRSVRHDQVMNLEDPHLFVHIALNELDQSIADRITHFHCTLDDLGVSVSTGRVVDFRAKEYLLAAPTADSAPLIYPTHITDGFVAWPKVRGKKPNALRISKETESLLLPWGHYVVVKRFTSKEEARRIVAAVYDPLRVTAEHVGFENHLNVYHTSNHGLDEGIAQGLAVYLNSTLVDVYFRQFNGHTQVNATDLRSLAYPERAILVAWGRRVGDTLPTQDEIDRLIEEELQQMAELETPDPTVARKRVAEALVILKALGMPRAQQNDRSAMTLLALLDMTPEQAWQEAGDPRIGITPILEFIKEHYGVTYAPNTRETIRRQTMHQFVQATVAVENPDQPDRPKNSPHWCYQVEPKALALLRSYGSDAWETNLRQYLKDVGSLKDKYDRRRKMTQVPVVLSSGQTIELSSGAHSELMKAVVEQFGPRFAPNGKLVYVGDTGDKRGYFNLELLASLGVSVDLHGKMPDVVIYHTQKEWLLLIEAVTSHGPVDPKRRIELKKLFGDSQAGLVFVTAFLTKKDLAKYIGEISWETEVWIAETPTHMIHFDGERFLGPHD